MKIHSFTINYIPISVRVETDKVTVDAGHERSARHVIQVYNREDSDLQRITAGVAKGLAVAAAAAWRQKEAEGGW